MTPIEIELKWRICPEHAGHLMARLSTLLGPGRGLVQSNRFFDSADRRLRLAGYSCRLRSESARAWLTCKGRLAAQHGATRHLEHEWALRLGEAAHLRESPAELAARLPPAWRAALGDATLIDIGGFINHRREWPGPDVIVCLDRTLLSRRIDHELELELTQGHASGTTRAVAAQWATQLAAWRIPWHIQRRTKFARALG